FAFCAWDSGFLPTDAEWNYAAAGGGEQRAYPWSNPAGSLAIDCSYANYFNGSAYCGNPPIGGVNPVGTESPKGDGTWGQADLGGNVDEWTLDESNSYPIPCVDCADLRASPYRVQHGGGNSSPAVNVREALQSFDTPDSRQSYSGVRCARTP